jgi:hypothetical protein
MKTRIILIALLIIANSSSAKFRQGNSYSSQNGNVTEQMTLKTSRLENSHNLVADPIEPAKKSDKPKDDSKKPKRHIFLKVVAGVVGTFIMVISILFGFSDNGGMF